MYWHWLDALPEFVKPARAVPRQDQPHRRTLVRRDARLAGRTSTRRPGPARPPIRDLGDSLGALVAYELCHKLVAGGAAPPVRLFVAGHAAPHLPRPRPPVHHLPDDGFLAELNRLGGTPPEVLADKQSLRLILPALRADYRIAERYRWSNRPALPVPITVFGGLADPDAPPAALRTWRQHTSATVSVSLYPGGHFFLHDADAGLHHRIADHLDSTKLIAPSPGACRRTKRVPQRSVRAACRQ